MMATSFKALSALLSYPSEELQAALTEIRGVLAEEGLVPRRVLATLSPFLDALAGADLIEAQERYVELFDRGRHLSLHLFEHVHGESRDRGQAMVDLAALYERGGMALSTSELPDYLPLFLEYLSTRPVVEALGELANARPIVEALGERLARRDGGYGAVMAAVAALAGSETTFAGEITPYDRDDDLAALDAAWEETVVTFGPGDAAGGCSTERLRIQMRAGSRDARRGQAEA
ncbi:nitrate reductase 1 molybdenum cofactor assembly chaperone [Hyphomicrobiales bacterium]|nr:nitrate reductase 1 molybdenum cofactor assembly chaperone [Hyphomicrobiales bacterium]CAH1691700.1 nitrate reductase 1 molybdenum cofactor assembly chaperone [Hyphomicrobiales bacterium]